MAVQQLTQPIINPIAAFDATRAQEITFLSLGGAQVVGNRIVINDNQTGDLIYDNKVITMKLAHTIPANTLTNGGYYNIIVYTIDSANNLSQPSVPVPFYCYSQPTLTIDNISDNETIENGTYEFRGSYAQQEGELLNSYQFVLYDSNKTVLSQSDVIYYTSDNSLSYTFVGMSNDTAYYVELKGQTVNNTNITTGLLYFTVRYSQPVSFAIVDLVNDCENGFIQISSNIVAIDGKSNPEPPIYIDDKEVDLKEPDSWVRWDEGFNIKDDFTMRVWGRDFNDFEPIITLSNKNNTDSEPNKIEMKWMIADVMKILPDYTLVSGKNISIVDGYKTDINDLAIYGNSEQIKKDSIDFGTANSMTIDTTEDMFLDIDVYGNQYQATREGYNFLKVEKETTTTNGITFTVNQDGSITCKGTATAAAILYFKGARNSIYPKQIIAGKYKLVGGTANVTLGCRIGSRYYNANSVKTIELTEQSSLSNAYIQIENGRTVNNETIYPLLYEYNNIDKPYEQYGASPSPDYPSEVETVKDSVEIDVVNKNLVETVEREFSKEYSSNYGMAYESLKKPKMLKANKIYAISLKCKSNKGKRFNKVILRDGNADNYYWTIYKTIPTTYTIYSTVFKPANDIIVTELGLQTAEIDTFYFADFLIEAIKEGSTSSDYTEHQSQTAILPIQQEMLTGDYISSVEHHEWGKIESYNGETITTDYISTTGQLTTGATVYYKLATPIDLELTDEQKTVKNTLINAYEPITNVYASDDLSLLKVYTTPIPSPKLPSKINSSGDKKNQLKDLGIINIDYTQGYFETTDTNFILKPDFVYNLSFDYIVNNTTTDLYFTVSYKSNGEIFDITNASQYTNKTTGRNNISFIVPADIPANSTLSIKFARTIIQADVSVSVRNVALVKGRFAADYQSPDIYNICPTATQKNIFNYNDIYYIKNQNATLTFIQNGFSSEVITTGEKSFFEFGFPNILQPGHKYAISYNSYGAIKSAKVYTMDKETGKTLEQIVTENGVFTAPSNLYDIKAEFVLDDSVADNQVQVWNIQLESGEQVTETETYTANSIDLTLEQPLRGIGDYRDLACLESPNILNPETQTAIVKGSTTYSLSQSGTTAYKFDYINEDNNVISSENMASGQFTTPDNCVRIKFDTTSDIITTNKLQVNLGNTAMVYYPYVNEPSIIRYIGEVVLTGDEEWSKDLFNKYAFVLQNIHILDCMLPILGKSNMQICSHFKVGVPGYDTENTNCFSINNGGVLVFQYEISRTTEEWKAYLKQQYETGTPVIVNYVLANPTVEQLSSDNTLALQNLKTYEGISNVFTNNNMPANLNLSYISGQSKQETKNAYITLKCWNGNVMPYFIHSNYIDIPKETDKVFIWLRKKSNIFDLKIENLGDYGEDKPGNKGNPQVAITVDDTTTTTITITSNTIDTATLSNVKFSKDNGATWDAEIPLDGLSSTDTYTFIGLQPATTYQIRVEATNVNGITGGITQQVTTRAS